MRGLAPRHPRAAILTFLAHKLNRHHSITLMGL
nr:MAG TPA: hypothetical protein [Caudoviricetes sp.]